MNLSSSHTTEIANNKTLAIDCMGGDFGPSVIIPAVVYSLENHSDLFLHLVGDKNRIEPLLKKHLSKSSLGASCESRMTVIHTSDVIGMDEKPTRALRRTDSSMFQAVDLVKQGKAQACVSSGNTGALMALATMNIGTLSGVERPAIVVELPNRKNTQTYMLDLGANIDASAEQLASFAVMGSVLADALSESREKPSVALLNIGEEAIKGRDSIQLAAKLLQKHTDLNFQGYVEANHIYNGEIDVIVCDGFTGNNVLKASEGIARFLYDQLKAEFESGYLHKLRAFFVKPVLKAYKKRINPDQYNGASLLGLREIVIKSHGSADKKATYCAINKAIHEIERQIPQRIENKVAQLLVERDDETLN